MTARILAALAAGILAALVVTWALLRALSTPEERSSWGGCEEAMR